MRFRLTRLDVLLICALLLFSGIWVVLVRQAGPSVEKRQAISSWHAEQTRVKENLQTTMSLGRKNLEDRIRENPSLLKKIELAFCAALFVMALSLWSAIRLVYRILRGRSAHRRVGAPSPPTWTFRQIVRLFVGLLIVTQAALLAEWAFVRSFLPKGFDPHVAALWNTLLIDAAVIVGGVLLMRRAVVNRIFSQVWMVLRFGAASYLTFLPFLGLIMLGVAQALSFFKQDPAPQLVFTMYLSENRAPVLGWLLFLVTVAGPVAEEFFFRGLLYGWLRTRLGVARGLLLSSFLFAGIHGDPVVFLPIFALGLLFGWVYEQTGSLAAPIAIHVAHNGGMLYLASLLKSILSLGHP